MTNIWAWRDSITHGWRWVLHRDSLPENVDGWLTHLRAGEPEAIFVASDKRPRGIPKGFRTTSFGSVARIPT